MPTLCGQASPHTCCMWFVMDRNTKSSAHLGKAHARTRRSRAALCTALVAIFASVEPCVSLPSARAGVTSQHHDVARVVRRADGTVPPIATVVHPLLGSVIAGPSTNTLVTLTVQFHNDVRVRWHGSFKPLSRLTQSDWAKWYAQNFGNLNLGLCDAFGGRATVAVAGPLLLSAGSCNSVASTAAPPHDYTLRDIWSSNSRTLVAVFKGHAGSSAGTAPPSRAILYLAGANFYSAAGKPVGGNMAIGHFRTGAVVPGCTGTAAATAKETFLSLPYPVESAPVTQNLSLRVEKCAGADTSGDLFQVTMRLLTDTSTCPCCIAQHAHAHACARTQKNVRARTYE